ncbi:MAG: hypothetical protein ACYC1D_06865 [Acidimicrobiales bacterium]
MAAIDAILSHLERGDLYDGLVFDAVGVRLIEIGEAVKVLPAELLANALVAICGSALVRRFFRASRPKTKATPSSSHRSNCEVSA